MGCSGFADTVVKGGSDGKSNELLAASGVSRQFFKIKIDDIRQIRQWFENFGQQNIWILKRCRVRWRFIAWRFRWWCFRRPVWRRDVRKQLRRLQRWQHFDSTHVRIQWWCEWRIQRRKWRLWKTEECLDT